MEASHLTPLNQFKQTFSDGQSLFFSFSIPIPLHFCHLSHLLPHELSVLLHNTTVSSLPSGHPSLKHDHMIALICHVICLPGSGLFSSYIVINNNETLTLLLICYIWTVLHVGQGSDRRTKAKAN